MLHGLWPSIILEINKGTAKVAFFNSEKHAHLGFKKIMLVRESDALIKRHLNKHLELTKAYNEMLIVVNAKKRATFAPGVKNSFAIANNN